MQHPFVTLTFAQSLDGSIAARPGAPLRLSGEAAQHFTHQLRAAHDAILVGIGTVLADDPQLNVRLVHGPNPRPIILDSHLRCPPTARCVDAARRTIIATTDAAPLERQRLLEAAGAHVLRLPTSNRQVDLEALLYRLSEEKIRTVMVEGGAHVITSFLRARLVNRLIITITPLLVGGVHSITELLASTEHLPRLRHATLRQLGEDWIIAGDIDWDGT